MTFSVEDPLLFFLLNNPAPKMHAPVKRKKFNLVLSFLSALHLNQSGLELCEGNFCKVEGWEV